MNDSVMAMTLQFLEPSSGHNSRRQGRASWVPSIYGCLLTGPFLCRLIDCSWLQLYWLPDMNGYNMPRRQHSTSLLSTPLPQGSWSFRRDKINVMLREAFSLHVSAPRAGMCLCIIALCQELWDPWVGGKTVAALLRECVLFGMGTVMSETNVSEP